MILSSSLLQKTGIVFKYILKVILNALKQFLKLLTREFERLILLLLSKLFKFTKALWLRIDSWGNYIFDDQNHDLNDNAAQYLIETTSREHPNGIEWDYNATDDILIHWRSKINAAARLFFLEISREINHSMMKIQLFKLLQQKQRDFPPGTEPAKTNHQLIYLSKPSVEIVQIISFLKAVKEYLSTLFRNLTLSDTQNLTPEASHVSASSSYILKAERFNRLE